MALGSSATLDDLASEVMCIRVDEPRWVDSLDMNASSGALAELRRALAVAGKRAREASSASHDPGSAGRQYLQWGCAGSSLMIVLLLGAVVVMREVIFVCDRAVYSYR
jgi:hypothetical protein